MRASAAGLLRTAIVIVLVAASVSAAAEDIDEYTSRITNELRAKNADAAILFGKANEARAQERWPQAERLYREVRRLEPTFFHATRRLCGAVLNQGRRAQAIPLCREALEAADLPENHEQLLAALVQGGKARMSDAEISEARKEGNLLLSLPDTDPRRLTSACIAFVALDDLDTVRRCAVRVQAAAPGDTSTHVLTWMVAMSDHDSPAAYAALEKARGSGMPAAEYAKMKAETDSEMTGIGRVLRTAGLVLGVWIAGLLTLFGLGLVLSRIALKAAQAPPTTGTGESAGLTRQVRLVYQAVLWAGGFYYYLSIPIILAVVVVGAGGLIYLSFAFGHVPLKLIAVVAIVALVTMWTALKSLFVRVRDEDPGDRLETGGHPRLQAVLDEVAARIGTRVVDSVYMTPGTDLAVTERGGMLKQFRGGSERCLILGVGVLDDMKIGPFKAILAHEYGHFSNRDTAGGGFALAVRRSLLTMAYGLAAGGAATWYNPAWLFLKTYNLIFLRISQGASRLQEIMADRWAAFAYGAAAFEQGLRHVVERSVRFEAHANSTLQEVIDGKLALTNLYAFKPSKAPGEAEILEAVGGAMEAKPSPYDSHPSPAERFALVHALPVQGVKGATDADADAWSLFESPASIQCWMTDRVRKNLETNHGVTIAGP